MKICIQTFGCAANKADADFITSILSEKHEITDEKESEIVIILTCGVKGPTENRTIEKIKKIRNKRVIIAGCLPRIIKDKLLKLFSGYSLIGPDQIQDILNIVEKERLTSIEFKDKDIAVLKDPKKIQPILICEGCLGNCSYCGTKFARGNLKSFPIKSIVSLINFCVKKGTKKVLLTAQDTGCYGKDSGASLPGLLKEVLKIPGKYKIRIGMMNPEHVREFLPELIEVYKNPKIIKFLHIPVQSGSDKILKDMNRKYLIEEFEKIIDSFRKEIPGIKIVTDVIVGFPTESEEDFNETFDLLKKLKFDRVNISKFYPRPMTPAKKMKQLPSETLKERSRILSKEFKTSKKYQ